MSAYDKDFSDAIYGVEEDGRYVTESRLKKMLTHEVDLIEKRLDREKHPNKIFFSYANTVATIDFAKQFKGHGWVGIKYQVQEVLYIPKIPFLIRKSRRISKHLK
jgi:Holliday junction resolvase